MCEPYLGYNTITPSFSSTLIEWGIDSTSVALMIYFSIKCSIFSLFFI